MRPADDLLATELQMNGILTEGIPYILFLP